MGKISPVSIKYIIHATMDLTGIADRPDIIGAIFGQTEGLMGPELELRELQKSGRVGRIDVKLDTKGGKTAGEILLPTSMGKSETAIVAAALETIERVGPCDAKITVKEIEDVRISKRKFILERAKQLLQGLIMDMPDSQAFTNEVTSSIREQEIVEYGVDKVPAGPMVDESEEVIIVEGRADVLNLLRYGIRNAVALKGSKVPDTILNLVKTKVATLFVDGDRGGDLIVRRFADLTDLDYVAKAPDGKEVEELTLKEIHKAIRSRIAWAQIKGELTELNASSGESDRPRQDFRRPPQQQPQISVERAERPERMERQDRQERPDRNERPERQERSSMHAEEEGLPKKDQKILKQMAEELVGSRGAFVLDEALNILGKVPVKELTDTLQNMSEGIFAVVLDGPVDQKLVKIAETKGIKYVVSKTISARSNSVKLMAPEKL